jgi:hypothetical protein
LEGRGICQRAMGGYLELRQYRVLARSSTRPEGGVALDLTEMEGVAVGEVAKSLLAGLKHTRGSQVLPRHQKMDTMAHGEPLLQP